MIQRSRREKRTLSRRASQRRLRLEQLESRRLLAGDFGESQPPESAHDGFSLVFAGDPQYYRVPLPPRSEACVAFSGIEIARCHEDARQANQHAVEAIKKIDTIEWPSTSSEPLLTEGAGDEIPKPEGVVVNGDLTEYFHIHEIAQYMESWEGPLHDAGLPVYAGLGNHDIDLRDGNGAIKNISNHNEALWFMADRIGKMISGNLGHEPIINADVPGYVKLKSPEVTTFGVTIKSGSTELSHDLLVFAPLVTHELKIPSDVDRVTLEVSVPDLFAPNGLRMVDSITLDGHQGHFIDFVAPPNVFSDWSISRRSELPERTVFGRDYDPASLLPGYEEIVAVKRPDVWPSGSSGSLAYSWDIGDYHFVQLHNTPGVEHEFPEHFGIPSFQLKKSYDWLSEDLAAADRAGKRTVINVHTAKNPSGKGAYVIPADDQDFKDAIAGKNVIAIFAGHTHDNSIDEIDLRVTDAGEDGRVGTRDDRQVPVMIAGAGFNSRFLITDFQDDYLNVGAIDASGGTPTFEAAKTFRLTPITAPDFDEASSPRDRVVINVLQNDSPSYYAGNNELRVTSARVVGSRGLSVSPAPAGSVSIRGDQVAFQPGTTFGELGEGQTGEAIVRYTVEDASGATSQGTITIDVHGESVARVTSTGNTGPGTLRRAILDANQFPALDTIVFDDAVTRQGTIFVTSALPTITDDLTLRGPGADQLRLYAFHGSDQVRGTGDGFRIVTVNDGNAGKQTSVTIEGLTLSGGDVPADDHLGRGGAILNYEDLILKDVALVANDGYDGGALANASGGHVTIVGSTLKENLAHRFPNGSGGFGGAIFNPSNGGVAILNSTLSLNTAEGSGGALASFGSIAISSATIVANAATGTGGVLAGGSEERVIQNTIISKNFPTNRSGSFTGTHNLIVSSPGIDAPNDNGGSTETHALLESSPALDAGLTRSPLIRPTSVSSSTSNTDEWSASNLINESGIGAISDDTYRRRPHHSANSGNAWKTADVVIGDYFEQTFFPPPIPELTFQLGQLYEVSEMIVWGFVRELFLAGTDRSQAKEFEVSFSTDGGQSFRFPETVTTGFARDTTQKTLAFRSPRLANAIRVRVVDNQGVHTFPGIPGRAVGISEVRFRESTVDQRGTDFKRQHVSLRDIGAFEMQNFAPVLTSAGNIHVNENTRFVQTLIVADPDPGDSHTFTIDATTTDSSKFEVVGNRLRFRAGAIPDFESPGDADGDNLYEVGVVVTDSGGKQDSQTIHVRVSDVSDETGPVPTSIKRHAPMAETTNADGLTFRIEFDEPVRDISAADFAVAGGSTAGITGVTAVQGTGESIYEITVSGGSLVSFNGTAGIRFAPNADIVDQTGNPMISSTPAIDESYSIDNLAPKMGELSIGEGTDSRSVIRSLAIDFDSPIVFDEGAFELQSADGTPVEVTTDVTPGTITNQVNLTFPGTDGGSLADGRYRLSILDTHLRDVAGNALDGDADGEVGGVSVDEFFRFYGDADGDGDVDGLDYTRFAGSFLRTASHEGFLSEFDFDNDGDVDGLDYVQFGQRFLKTLSP